MLTSSPISQEAERILSAELNREERLLWAGQPLPGRSGWGGLPLFLFGIPWTAFSIFWIVTAASMGQHNPPHDPTFSLFSNVFPLFGVPFVLIGIGMLASPFWMRKKEITTVYALTDSRALILTPGWGGAVSVRSIPPEDLAARTRTQNPDGSGSLTFTRLNTLQRRAGPDGGTYTVTVGFRNIADVRAVDDLIERTYRPPEDGSPAGY